jgi:hypothetical protein
VCDLKKTDPEANMSSKAIGGAQKSMLQPIAVIFRYLQNKSILSIWLYEQKDTRIEGKLIVPDFPLVALLFPFGRGLTSL